VLALDIDQVADKTPIPIRGGVDVPGQAFEIGLVYDLSFGVLKRVVLFGEDLAAICEKEAAALRVFGARTL